MVLLFRLLSFFFRFLQQFPSALETLLHLSEFHFSQLDSLLDISYPLRVDFPFQFNPSFRFLLIEINPFF